MNWRIAKEDEKGCFRCKYFQVKLFMNFFLDKEKKLKCNGYCMQQTAEDIKSPFYTSLYATCELREEIEI